MLSPAYTDVNTTCGIENSQAVVEKKERCLIKQKFIILAGNYPAASITCENPFNLLDPALCWELTIKIKDEWEKVFHLYLLHDFIDDASRQLLFKTSSCYRVS